MHVARVRADYFPWKIGEVHLLRWDVGYQTETRIRRKAKDCHRFIKLMIINRITERL